MDKDYILFADTDCDITPEIAKKYGYKLVSMPYKIGDNEVFPYEDFETFEAHEFYEKLRNGTTPTTSALSPKKYEDYFEPYFKEGKDILYVHFSKQMSSTFNAMSIAMKTLKEKYPERTLYTIDTKAITVCALNILYEIGEMYQEGKSIEDIMKWSETEVDKFAIYLFANDLSFFRRSGRVKFLAAVMGNMLGIRPIINIGEDGVMKSVDKARGLKSTIDKILENIDKLQEDIESHRVLIAHTDAEANAKLIADRIKEKYPNANIEIMYANPTAGSHCGPDSVGVSFHVKHR